MDETPAYDTYFVFSTQREVKGRGMKVATFAINPVFALIVDTVNADDFPDAKNASAILGDGAVLKYSSISSLRTNVFLRR